MNVQRMRHFLAVADNAHFGRAAIRLGMAQPPLSQSIQRLERELGVRLFDRTRSGVHLTASGLAFLVDARAAVSATDRAIARARSALDPCRPVRVGIVEGALWQPMRDLLRIARAKSIAVELVDGATGDQLRRLAAGTLELAFIVPPYDVLPRLQVIDLPARPVMAALPADRSMSGDDPVSLDILAEGLIIFLRENGRVVHDAILAMFERHGLKPTITRVAPRVLSGLAMVAAGVGAAIVPAAIAENLSVKGVVFRPIDLDEGIPSWSLSLAYMPVSARSDAAALLSAWRQETVTV
jgi:DNA-binding transcriptional LysR family regulator